MVENEEVFTVKDLAINGQDIINKLHIKPSKAVGEILNKTLLFVMENPENNEKEILLNYIMENYGWFVYLHILWWYKNMAKKG